MSYMTYLPLDHYIIKIVLFHIMVNILYIFLISIIFLYEYDPILLFSPFRLITTQLNYYYMPTPMYTVVHVGLLLFIPSYQ